jgi:hypothetical protein
MNYMDLCWLWMVNMLLQLFTIVQFHVTRLQRHVKLLCGFFDMLDMSKDCPVWKNCFM